MNDRIPRTPPIIRPLKYNGERPVWSIMIPAYNCFPFLRETLESVLVQDEGPQEMQIEVIDDCSVDGDIKALVEAIGKGRIGYFRQEVNKGSLRNFETCLNRAKGKWIHLLHGDDLIKPGFYKEIDFLLNKYPEAGAAFTNVIFTDEEGRLEHYDEKLLQEPGIIDNFLLEIAQINLLQPPSIVVKRSVYEQLGGFYAAHYGEDWEMWVRIAAHFPIAYSPKHLAKYRVRNSNNISTFSFLSAENIKDIREIINIINKHLPKEHRNQLKKKAKKRYAEYASGVSYKIYHELKNPKAALAQAIGAVKLYPNKTTLLCFAKVLMKNLIKYKY